MCAVEQVCDLEAYSTDLQWCPVRTKQAGSDIFAVACTDGSFKLFAKTGRLEKSVEAHQGACISLRWNHEGARSPGSSLVTSRLLGFLLLLPYAVVYVASSTRRHHHQLHRELRAGRKKDRKGSRGRPSCVGNGGSTCSDQRQWNQLPLRAVGLELQPQRTAPVTRFIYWGVLGTRHGAGYGG